MHLVLLYTVPIWALQTILYNKARGGKRTKTYLCLIVCTATKALHFEVVFSLSTEAFLAALRRIIARRECCSKIYSDSGTNFVGPAQII